MTVIILKHIGWRNKRQHPIVKSAKIVHMLNPMDFYFCYVIREKIRKVRYVTTGFENKCFNIRIC